jgi:XTP/dITP diphosphohydrolase
MILIPNSEMLVATRNPGKVREIQEALSALPLKLRYLVEFANVSTVGEDGRTYEENAALKALSYAKQTGVCALADDSGLEVDALGGMPGVFSARFGGDHASDQQRIDKLLTALSQHQDKERTARFVCWMALAGWESKEDRVNRAEPSLLRVAEASCEGSITTAVRGANGFGYDPVFVPAGYDATFGELPSAVKSQISHRALALSAMREFLERCLA